MSALTVSPAYTALLARIPPRVVRSEEQNESYIAALYELERRHNKWSEAERELADLLTLLIEDFEEKNYQLPKASPLPGDCISHGAAWPQAKGPCGRLRHAQYRLRGDERQARTEQAADSPAQRPLPRLA